MNELVQKLLKLEKNISAEKGDFLLFALFLREDAPDRWDLLVSAPWIHEDKPKALKYLTNKVQKILTNKELILLSRIVLIDENNPALEAIHQTVNTEHKPVEITDNILFGLPIKHAYLITSQKDLQCQENKKSYRNTIIMKTPHK